MTRHDKIEAVIAGLFFGFLILSLMEQQHHQTARIRALRKRLLVENGNETDTKNLNSDWQKIQADLRTASIKVLNDVQQVTQG